MCSLAALLAVCCGVKEDQGGKGGGEIDYSQIEVKPAVGKDLYGQLTDTNGKPIRGVVVSDGTTSVATNAYGIYQIKRNPEAKFVYYSTPWDYEIETAEDCSAAKFYAEIPENAGVHRQDFQLRKRTGDASDFTVIGADSILMAEKVSRETGMCVMPHICCRDKNAIAMRSQLLGAHINDINNFLVITGDPIPSVVRASVKSVFNFDSVGLMNIISDMNQEQFAGKPVIYGGAINQGRVNFKVELERVKKKMEAGATFFMTQPVFSDEDIDRLRQIKEQTGARILCGIMPFVSLRNATFMKNEMTGINVTDEILSRYRADMSKEEGEETGIQIAREIIAKTTDFVDGYYFSFPFNRVHMLKKIIGKNNQ